MENPFGRLLDKSKLDIGTNPFESDADAAKPLESKEQIVGGVKNLQK